MLVSFRSPWDLKNIAFSLRRSSKSSFSLFSLRTPPWVSNINKNKIVPPSTPKGTPEESRSAQERPGKAPRPSQNHPRSALRGPLGVQQFLGWCWGPRGLILKAPEHVLHNLSYLFAPLFSLLFSVKISLLCMGCAVLCCALSPPLDSRSAIAHSKARSTKGPPGCAKR